MVHNDNVRKRLPSKSPSWLPPVPFYLMQQPCVSVTTIIQDKWFKIWGSEKYECLQHLTAYSNFYINWHPLRSIKLWTPDEPSVSLRPLVVLTVQYIITAFLPTTSFGFTTLLGPGSPSAGMMSLCSATAGKDHRVCRCVFSFVRLLWRSLFCLFWWWLNLCQERKKPLKYRNLNAHVFLSWFQTSESPPTSHICTAIYTCLVSCSLRLLPLVGEPIDQSELYRWRMVMPSFFIFSYIPWYIHER